VRTFDNVAPGSCDRPKPCASALGHDRRRWTLAFADRNRFLPGACGKAQSGGNRNDGE